MSVNIIEAIIPVSSKVRPATNHSKKWIVIHETGNKSKGATAKNHSTYLNNLSKANNTYLSWHYTVDDHEIYHHIPDNEIAWHAGDGTSENGGNISGIGIEICVNSDGNFDRARDNAAWLTAKLLKDNGWGIDRVKQHHDFSSYGKNCPETIRNQHLWGSFLNDVTNYLNSMNGSQNTNKSVPEASSHKFKIGDKVTVSSGYRTSTDEISQAIIYGKNTKSGTITRIVEARNPYLVSNGNTPICWCNDGDIRVCNGISMDNVVIYYPKYAGGSGSIVDALSTIGVDSSYTNRAKIATVNGIKNYTGTAEQNMQMLNLLKLGKLIKK